MSLRAERSNLKKRNYLKMKNFSTTIGHKRQTFGKSRLGAPLEVFGNGSPPLKYLLIAGQHGTEPEGTQLLSSVMRTISEEKLHCAVIPCLNPDGLARGTRGNSAGVDLNRNFPSINWSPRPVHYHWNDEDDKEVEIGTGAHAASEPETQALIKLITSLKPEHIITIHAPLNCIDDPLASPLAKHLVSECGLPLVTDIGYPTPGSLGSWAKEQNLHLITIELPHDTIQNIRKRFGPLFEKIMRDEIAVPKK
jgi:protein MpaA